MLDANHIRHLKVLGKICYLYDTAGSQQSTMELGLSRLADQVAAGDAPSLPGVLTIANFLNAYDSAISAGQEAQQTVCMNMATAYLISEDFRNDLVDNTPETPGSVASVLDAWALELTNDSKTLTTESSTGFVNFFENVLEATEDFPEAGSPTYADSTYVVAAIV